ncbi:YeeE/YedE family protein [Chitinophagales bacterium]|nr:YeeE/YedE family protein [Chitinophagales bacterium]
MIEFISQAWPWYISGPSIAVIMFLLLWAGGAFGVSSTFRSLCAIGGAGKKIPFFNYNWKAQSWNLVFVVGAALGGFIAQQFFHSSVPLSLSANTIADLSELGIAFNGSLVPSELFSWENALSLKGLLLLTIGGFLVGFGARYAGGCTSGHAISGLSNFQLSSLVAVVGFFIGGLLMTHLILPLILSI